MNKGSIALLASMACACSAYGTPTLSFSPANPTPADTVTVTIRDSTATCPYVVPGTTRLAPGNELRVLFNRIGDCGFGPFAESSATLGQLPAGTYTVTLTFNYDGTLPPPVDTKTLTVAYPAGTGTIAPAAPLENYAGHYLTDIDGEGVFIEQYGTTTFLSFFTYGATGQPTWLVMPAMRWEFNAVRSRSQFTGAVYTASRSTPPPAAGTVAIAPAGTGSWYPSGFERGVLELTVGGMAVNRNLRRFKF
jgi:hypothetical protein